MIGWLLSRKRRRLTLLDVDAKLAQAQEDRAIAQEVKVDAQELATWADQMNQAGRFDVQLHAAWRLHAGRGN